MLEKVCVDCPRKDDCRGKLMIRFLLNDLCLYIPVLENQLS
jgi:hypothetical protein